MRRTICLIAFTALAFAACSGTPPTKAVTLLAEDIEWSSNLIEAEPGQPIELTIRNVGALDHNFVLEELGLDILLTPGESETITIQLAESGRYEFICDIPGHEEAGMVGELVIGAEN